MEKPEWFKIKGYYHISPQSKMEWKDTVKTINKITNPDFISKYSFYPLLHTNIKERKFKKHPTKKDVRCHSYFDAKKNKYFKTSKIRPLHYANHFDALIFGYYASILQEKYENSLHKTDGLSDCVTAYRKIPIDNSDKHKGTIHFANEAFKEIKDRVTKDSETAVLAFDIKSFFSTLNHEFLRDYWKEIMGFETMKADHESVLKAATNFSFIYKDDLRQIKRNRQGRRPNFDEKKLAEIGNKKGFSAFFESPKEFRENIKAGTIHIFKNTFKNEKKEMIGIPQGLPISAVLANLYLLHFDKSILQKLVKENGCFYRRYSDDIVIICKTELIEHVANLVKFEMEKCKVVISDEKTETFLFKTRSKNNTSEIYSTKITTEGLKENIPFIYLGFEFYGNRTLIKSSNLSKFYRRMIYAIKAKSKIANKLALRDGTSPVLFKRQLYKIYRNINLDKVNSKRRFKTFIKKETGEFSLTSKESNKKSMGNYFSYAERAAEIMNEPAILNQIKGEKRVFNQAIQKHFKDKRN
jgi:hypothetical protein